MHSIVGCLLHGEPIGNKVIEFGRKKAVKIGLFLFKIFFYLEAIDR